MDKMTLRTLTSLRFTIPAAAIAAVLAVAVFFGWGQYQYRAGKTAGAHSERLAWEEARRKLEAAHARRIAADDSYYRAISAGWSEALKLAFESLPDYSFYHRSGG